MYGHLHIIKIDGNTTHERRCFIWLQNHNMGTRAVVFEPDGWTVRTRDRKPAAHYEFAVAVRKGGADVLTDFSIIEEAINK